MSSRQWQIHLTVIGLRFRWKKDGRRAIADLIQHKGDITGVRLEREPDNEYDANAIAVYLPERLIGGKQLGYIRRDTAELLAPKLDSGAIVFKRAVLTELDETDDWNTGEMLCYFEDRVKKPAAKTKTRS